ncbi:MAG: tRNA pseudouridine55 synthase [Hyphomicrobiaceae bacterium]|jgi:tRNA pseudouridine55 synthase
MGRRKNAPGPSGIVLVDKADEMTSARVVAIVRRVLGGVKTGHLGTLDPFATGLLPLCLGEGTKLAPYLNTAGKSYQGTIRLGRATDTDDRTGKDISSGVVPDLATIDWPALVERFSGEIDQVPPAYSAIKRDGRPMYELARKGQAVILEERRVTIQRLVLEPREADLVWVDLDCSKGTYVRSLARDLGEAIGCGGHLDSLRRTKFGQFGLEGAITLEEIEAEDGAERLTHAVLSLLDSIEHLRRFDIDAGAAQSLRSGQQHPLFGLERPRETGEKVGLAAAGDLVAVAVEKSGAWTLDRVFTNTTP